MDSVQIGCDLGKNSFETAKFNGDFVAKFTDSTNFGEYVFKDTQFNKAEFELDSSIPSYFFTGAKFLGTLYFSFLDDTVINKCAFQNAVFEKAFSLSPSTINELAFEGTVFKSDFNLKGYCTVNNINAFSSMKVDGIFTIQQLLLNEETKENRKIFSDCIFNELLFTDWDYSNLIIPILYNLKAKRLEVKAKSNKISHVELEKSIIDTLVLNKSTNEMFKLDYFNECLIDNLVIGPGLTVTDMSYFSKVIFKSIIIPDTLEIISENAFHNSSIKQIKLGNSIKTIDVGSFQNSSVINMEFPDSLERIADYAFYECKMLSSIAGSFSNLRSIGAHAFDKCLSLDTSIRFDSSFESIGDYAFYSLNNIKSVDFS